ncbi:MAG: PIN domain-containing protein [Actinomycetota bacterium]|nr:PIN domain-containing protein [Actinomycetota bacterium]
MTILDAYAVLALLKGEPAAPVVAELLRDDPSAALTALGVAGVLDHLIRLEGATEEDAALDVAQLGLADPEPVDAATALRAGALRARHYDRNHRAVSLADCVAAETARRARTALASVDPPLLDLCHDEAIDVVALPDSRGQRWSR